MASRGDARVHQHRLEATGRDPPPRLRQDRRDRHLEAAQDLLDDDVCEDGVVLAEQGPPPDGRCSGPGEGWRHVARSGLGDGTLPK
jgi:hypothetical protein